MSKWGERAKMIHIVPSASGWTIVGEKRSYRRGVRNGGFIVLPQCLTPDWSSKS